MNERPDRPDDSDNPESGHDRGLDVDAAFEQIVANFGPTPGSTPAVEEPEGSSPVVEEPEGRGRLETPSDPDPDRLRNLFRPAWDHPEPDDPEDHFVPPPPPPLPTPEPRRKLAWIALFGGPALMLLAIITGTRLPDWVMFLLSAGFVGGFVYLVATMGDSGRGHWPGDDGAVV